MTKTFMNKDYKTHKENILLEKEKSLLPSAQIELENILKIEKKEKEIQDIDEQIRELNRLKNTKYSEINHFRYSKGKEEKNERRKFIKQCPENNCRGYLSTQWKCGLCSCKVCKDCHEITQRENEEPEEHKCDPSLVDSVKAMIKDTKPCPGCGVPIHKISGCNQMFCVECSTAWSWNTGRIETGIIHNPHYYEWKRRNGELERAPGDVRCGGLVAIRELYRKLGYPYSRSNRGRDGFPLLQFHRSVGHYLAEMRELNQDENNPQIDLDLRIKYLRNIIDEDKWKIQLQRRNKKRMKETMRRDILGSFTTIITELLGNFVDNHQTKEQTLSHCINILEYCNKQIDTINKLFNSNMSKIKVSY
jgi:hypothetical protein